MLGHFRIPLRARFAQCCRGLLALCVSAGVVHAQAVYVRGDVSQDGAVSAVDALLILTAAAGNPLPASARINPNGDANCDGSVDTRDAILILQFAALVANNAFCVGRASDVATSIVITPASVNVNLNLFADLVADIRDAGGRSLVGEPLVWSSSPSGIFQVNPDTQNPLKARATAIAPGVATITATSGTVSRGITATAGSTPQIVARVAVTPATVPMEALTTATLTARAFTDTDVEISGQTFTWQSNNTAVATVNGSGIVTAVAAGQASVSARSSNGVSGIATINVVAATVSSVSITAGFNSIDIGETKVVSARAFDAGGRELLGRPVQWQLTQVFAGGFVPLSITATGASATLTGLRTNSGITLRATVDGKIADLPLSVLLPQLTITIQGPSSAVGGVVQSLESSPLVNCSFDATAPLPRTCTTRAYQANQSAALYAYPQTSTAFTSFAGDCTGATCTVLMDRPRNVTVNVRANEWSEVAAGGGFTCAIGGKDIAGYGALFCWGRNESGQLGRGNTVASLVPAQATFNERFRFVTAGVAHACAIRESDRRVACWGENNNGQLGIGTVGGTQLSPTPLIADGRTYLSVAAGGYHTCGVTDAGTIACWGNNFYGALGDGTTTTRGTPGLVSGFNGSASTVTAGVNFTCASNIDLVAYCWGDNTYGAVGNGLASTASVLTRSQVTGQSFGASLFGYQITASWYHVCAIRPRPFLGAVCWGRGNNGQIFGTVAMRNPTPLVFTGGATNIFALGSAFTCSDQGPAFNCVGEFQPGTPVLASPQLPSFPVVASGSDGHACAVVGASAGRLFCWGLNSFGQIGDGTVFPRHLATVEIRFP